MRKARILLILSVWITILPYLGFPYSWKDILTTFSGIGLVYVSFMLYKESKKGEFKKEKPFDSFKENSGFIKNENQNEIEKIIKESGEHIEK